MTLTSWTPQHHRPRLSGRRAPLQRLWVQHRREPSDVNTCVSWYIYVGLSPFPVTVTTRIITFLVGNPYKPSLATVTGKGDNPTYSDVYGRNGLFPLTYPVLHCVGISPALGSLAAHPRHRCHVPNPSEGRILAWSERRSGRVNDMEDWKENWWTGICMRDWIVSKHSNTSNAKYRKGGPHFITMKTSQIIRIADHKGQSTAETCTWALKERCNKKHSKTTTVLSLKHHENKVANTGTMWTRDKLAAMVKCPITTLDAASLICWNRYFRAFVANRIR